MDEGEKPRYERAQKSSETKRLRIKLGDDLRVTRNQRKSG